MGDNSFAGINFSDPKSKKIFKHHEDTMCPKFKENYQGDIQLDVNVKHHNNVFTISGSINSVIHSPGNYYILYSAASPPTYSSNYSGSGLPFPNEKIAFENSPNKGRVDVNNNNFTFSLNYPNSYYKNLGSLYVPPEVNIEIYDCSDNLVNEPIKINLGEGIPFRSLTFPAQRNWNIGPMFYVNNQMPAVRTQYQILVDSAYPKKNITPKNFWGLKPPM